MKPNKTYLKGKSVFIVSCTVIVLTVLIVYFTGIHVHRSITSNFFWSLSIISSALFLFLSYGLYKGLNLIDNAPDFKGYKAGEFITMGHYTPEMVSVESEDGISGLIISIVLWVSMSILSVVLIFVLEALFWFSIFIILLMLYWIFFRAMKLVFSKSATTQGSLSKSIYYAFLYTLLYSGWMFAIVFIAELLK